MIASRPQRSPWYLATLLCLAAGACATGGTGSAGGPGRSSDVITAAMLQEVPVNNGYEAVQRLRPRWLIERGPTTLNVGGNPVVVYVDNQRMGGVDELRNLAIPVIEQIRYLDASAATTRYGTGHANGAIEVTTKRR